MPILHTYAGYAVYRSIKKRDSHANWKWALFFILMANLPDFDFIPGVILGESGVFHRGISHSFIAGAALSLLLASLARRFFRISLLKVFSLSFIAFSSHLVLDIFTGATNDLFWPFDPTFFHSWKPPFPIIADEIREAAGLSSFLKSLLHPAIVTRFFVELLLVASIEPLSQMMTRIGGARSLRDIAVSSQLP